MIRTILIAFFIFLLVGLVIVWVVSGGIGKTWNFLSGANQATSTSNGKFKLPWQPDILFDPIVPLYDDTGSGYGSVSTGSDPATELALIEQDYRRIAGDAQEVLTFGDPSPFYGSVHIYSASYASETHPDLEYFVIEAPFQNTAPVSLSGWSVQSAVSGVRLSLPLAAPAFFVGAINTLAPLSLEPGASAIVVSGRSPVGVSFRENRCTGYLSQFQSFTPSLFSACPSPTREVPLDAPTIATFGEACIDAAHALPSCTHPQEFPPEASPACRSLLQTRLSYNGCMERHRSDVGFFDTAWRLYLESNLELWQNSHDVIRLLDARGQTVDVYTY